MNFALFSLFHLGFLAFYANAAPEPRPVKVVLLKGDDDVYQDVKTQQIPVSAEDNDDNFAAEHRQSSNTDAIDDYNYDDDDVTSNGNAEVKAIDTSARLFIRRFMSLSKNIFGNNKQRIIIQIFPNGTSSVTTLPATNVVLPSNIATPVSPVSPIGAFTPISPFRIANDDDSADLTQNVAGTINPQRKGSQKDQDIFLRIPAEYEYLFNSGQQIMLNANNGGNKRRVVNKKRVNKNRKGVNKNRKNKNNKNQYLQRTRFITV